MDKIDIRNDKSGQGLSKGVGYMMEVDEVFSDRISKEHVQREQMKKFADMLKEGKAISYLSEDEIKLLCLNLEQDKVAYSNDMVIDMIITFVVERCDDDKLLKILQHIKIAHVDEYKKIIGRAYPKYSDGSYYIEVGEDIDTQVRLLSDLFATLFMFNENLQEVERGVLYDLLEVNRCRYKNLTEFTDDFNFIQIKMMICDRLYEDDFTDRYIAYSREINEMALAFLIGHEIGHHYLGHTDTHQYLKNERKISELKADSFALDFAFQYLKKAYSNENNIYGIHFFAGIYLPLIASANFCRNIYKDDICHPALIKRLLGVQRGLKKKIELSAWEDTQEYRGKLLKIIDFPT